MRPITKIISLYTYKEQFTTSLFFSLSELTGLKIHGNSENIEGYVDFKELQLNFDKYDVIFGEFPYNVGRVNISKDFRKKIPTGWYKLLFSLRWLAPKGIAFFLVEPSILFAKAGKTFIKHLESEGFYITSVFEAPKKFHEGTNFRPILIEIQRKITKEYFIGEFSKGGNDSLIANYQERKSSDNISTGIIIDKESFESFNQVRISFQIESLKTQYKEYTQYQLIKLTSKINSTTGIFTDHSNSIYIRRQGTIKVFSSINELTAGHKNYFQLVLESDIVKKEYLILFFKSELGKLILDSMAYGSVIPYVSKTTVESAIVAVPSIDEQELLTQTGRKLDFLHVIIDELKNELSLNPKSANSILEKFDSISKPLVKLTIEEEILALIRKGESETVEFKQTFSKNIRTGSKDKVIIKSALKNVVGFLNADGGTLLIGVADDGTITGVEDDFFRDNDNYLLNFKNNLKAKVGPAFYPLIKYDLHTVFDKRVLRVNCKKSDVPCFYEEKEFFVRTNPATDKLEGKEQFEYISERFSS